MSFNHVIGLPRKNGQELPLFDYERLLFNTLENHKHLWIKKATGLGITEFMLRYIAWLCVRDDSLRRDGAQICIVTGPRIELAIGLIARLKGLFTEKLIVTFDTKETVIELNGVHIEAYPSHHLDAMRGLPDVSFILLDEADFFPPGQQQDARDVSESTLRSQTLDFILAITLIDRMKLLFTQKDFMEFNSKETTIDLNGIHIEAYPSHHLDAMRGLPNVSFIFLDEADFFPTGQPARRKRCLREIHR